MHVCYLINQLAPGGAPTLLLNIVRNLDDRDVSFTVCSLEGEAKLATDFSSAGAQVVDLSADFKFDPRMLAKLARYLRVQDFDLVHAHLPYAQTLARVMTPRDVPVVSTQHNVPENYHPITRAFEQITRSFDERTVAVSEGVERAFTGESTRYAPGQAQQWCTIYNGIDVESFRNQVRSADTSTVRERWNVDADLVYLNVSRYVSAKSQTDLVEAMSRVVDDDPDAHLLIVGWGDREPQIRRVVDEEGLDEYVTVTGRVPVVEEYYALADVFVSSSTFEGMPIAHLEAMAAGLPIVATDIPGVREVVADGETGLLVPPTDPDALSEAMLDLRSAERRAEFSNAGYERVSGEFSIDQTVEDHITLYRELINY